MSCPDRFTLFCGLEQDDPEIREHLAGCPVCARLAEAERELAGALGRLRDPAPPADLLAGVWQLVDEAAAAQARLRRQVSVALGVALATAGTLLTLFWRELVVDTAVDALVAVSQLQTAALAIGRALGARLLYVAVPVVSAQLVALVLAALVFHRLLSVSRVRS